MGNTTGATCGAGIIFPSGAHEFSTVLNYVRVTAPSLVICVVNNVNNRSYVLNFFL